MDSGNYMQLCQEVDTGYNMAWQLKNIEHDLTRMHMLPLVIFVCAVLLACAHMG